MTDETCGEIKGNGEPCDNPVKYADGKCGIHSEVNGDTQGRPTKFTDERARSAIDAAREGKSKRGCERAAGVGKGTIDDWLDQSHTFTNDDGYTASFSTAFTQARAAGESRCIQNARSEDGNPSFEKFMLSSSYGYAEGKDVNVGGQEGSPVQIEFSEEVVETPWGDNE